jgi:hypothetical protein
MCSTTRTNGSESGTGQDTPLGVCPCPAPRSATPAGHGVTLSRPVPPSRSGCSWLKAKNGNRFYPRGPPLVPTGGVLASILCRRYYVAYSPHGDAQ